MRETVLVLQPRIKKVKLEKSESLIHRSESAMSISSDTSTSSDSSSSGGGEGRGAPRNRKSKVISL